MRILRRELPPGWLKKDSSHIELKYSILKSDGKLMQPQQLHCDVKQQWFYNTAKSNVKFPFSIIVGVENYSFLDFVHVRKQNTLQRICFQKGDLLFIRGDIPHRGTENSAEHEHYRVHIYCDPAGIKEDDKSERDVTMPADITNIPGPYEYDVAQAAWIQRKDESESESETDSNGHLRTEAV